MRGGALATPRIYLSVSPRYQQEGGHVFVKLALRPSSNSGLSLIEVMVAISIIAIVATASATLCLNGIAAAAAQERRQVAVTIASGAMESISAQSVMTNATTGVSGLYTGRTSLAITAAWASNASMSGVSQTYAA